VKEQNLYLYIPPHSSHPHGVFTGLIFGQVLRIRGLCSKQSDADDRKSSFTPVSSPVAIPTTSYSPCFAVPKRKENASNYLSRSPEEHERRRVQKKARSSDQVFFHLQFYPESPPSHDIQRLWRQQVSHPPGEPPLNTLKNLSNCEVGFSKLVVTYSWPLILPNRFSVRDIHNRGRPVSEYLAE
jgi:hypothetical protein